MQIMAGRLDFFEKHGFVVKRGSVYRVSDERLPSGAILDRAVALITNTCDALRDLDEKAPVRIGELQEVMERHPQ
jgi:hypothetical protein